MLQSIAFVAQFSVKRESERGEKGRERRERERLKIVGKTQL